MEKTLEELYGLKKNPVALKRVVTKSGKWLDTFKAPKEPVMVQIEFPEFTCLCPKTSHPDFATLYLLYIPFKACVELKAYKYYLNSFRNEGHFHEEVMALIYGDLKQVLDPIKMRIVGEFNVRGGTYPVVDVGDDLPLK